MNLSQLFEKALEHQRIHKCHGIPYQHGEKLKKIVEENNSTTILEVGTGVGYTAACLALGNLNATVDTIEQFQDHIDIARENWQELGINERIKTFCGKAEGILRELTKKYDFIFFDGYVPQTKMLVEFERLLKENGLLVTANLFLRDPNGGRYLGMLQNKEKWETTVFADTSISKKL